MRTAGGTSRRFPWGAQATGQPGAAAAYRDGRGGWVAAIPMCRSGEGSVEGVAAGAGPGGVRVVDREALLLDRVHKIDGGAAEVRGAHLVRNHCHPAELAHDVAVGLALVEVQLVAQARAAPGLHGNPQPQVVAALLLEEAADLGCCLGREVDARLRGRLVLNGHLVCSRALTAAGFPAGLMCTPNDMPPGGIPRPPAGITALNHRPGAPHTGNHRLRSDSIFRSLPTAPRTCISSALSRRSPPAGANG